MERYNPMEAEAFREQRLHEAKKQLDEIYIEYGDPSGFDYQIDPIKEREANFLLDSGAIREEDIILNDKNPKVDPETRQRYADGYSERPRDRYRDIRRQAYAEHPELFVVTNRTQKKLNTIKEKVIPSLQQDIWSLSPRPTPDEIQKVEKNFLTSRVTADTKARNIREVEACANYELGSSRALDSIRFAYPGYTQEDFRTLFLLLNRSFQEIYDEELPSREQMLKYRGQYSIATDDALSEQSLPWIN